MLRTVDGLKLLGLQRTCTRDVILENRFDITISYIIILIGFGMLLLF